MEYVLFGIVVAVIAAVGIRVGMLLAPRIDRLTTPDDEEPRD
jgi:hypothetical protein